MKPRSVGTVATKKSCNNNKVLEVVLKKKNVFVEKNIEEANLFHEKNVFVEKVSVMLKDVILNAGGPGSFPRPVKWAQCHGSSPL